MNAGTVACANTSANLMRLPHNAHRRAAAYADDHAQESHTFPPGLPRFPSIMSGGKVDIQCNEHPRRMPFLRLLWIRSRQERHPTGRQEPRPHPQDGTPHQPTRTPWHARRFCAVCSFHPSLRPHRPSSYGLDAVIGRKTCAYLWNDKTQAAYDEVRNLLWMASTYHPQTIASRFTAVVMPLTTASLSAPTSIVTYPPIPTSLSLHILPLRQLFI
jgi:hypothetical protein